MNQICHTTLRPLRILLILPEFPPSIGGMQSHAQELAAALVVRGHEVRVLAYQALHAHEMEAYRDYDQRQSFPITRNISRLGWRRNFQTIESEGCEFQPELIYSSTVFYGGAGDGRGVPVVCRSPGNDIQRPWIVWPFRFLSGFVSRPWFENSLYQIVRKLDYPQVFERLYYRLRRKLTAEAARQAACILANSEYTANHLRDAGVDPARIQVLPGGVDAKRFVQVGAERRAELRDGMGIPSDAFVLLTVCRMVKKKGVDFLIESLARLRESHPDQYLLVIGDGSRLKRWRRLAGRLGVEDRVKFVGRIPQESVHEWYGAADAFVLASRLVTDPVSGYCDAETMGRALCEANAASLPVLASESGGIPSIIRHRDNGLLFETDTYESFVEALGDLRGDAGLRESLIAGGLRRAREEFDWPHLVDVHERCFEEVLEATDHV